MAFCFFDTSALLKRYVREKGTAWTQSLLKPSARNIIYVSRMAHVEAVSAIVRRERCGDLTFD